MKICLLPVPVVASRKTANAPQARRRTLGLSALLTLAAATTAAAAPAKAVTSCQAIDSSSLLGMMPTIPSPACTTNINPGDTFEIDFSSVFGSNPGDFSVNNTYSLQIANLNTGPSNTLNFTDVEFLVAFNPNPTAGDFSSITIWRTNEGMDMFTPSFPYAQGLSNYTTNLSSNTFEGNPVSNKASFSLSGPNANWGLGTAGYINTFPVNLAGAGISNFTGAKIRGKFTGGTGLSGSPDFSAGLAIFTTNDPILLQPPNIIYGNAFNAVPGPLPILGAGAAFGWSRRLRRRVSAAAGCATPRS